MDPHVEPPVRVAAVQMVSTPDPERNMADAERLVAQAAADGATLVLLPEYFCLMGRHERDKLALAESAGAPDAPLQGRLSALARRHRIWVVAGSLPVRSGDPERVFNTTFVYNPDGEGVARYDKIHLFSFARDAESYDEGRTIAPGTQTVAFQAPFGRVGLSICYDLRFPELYRSLGDCALIVVPAAFTHTTGQAHWETLLRARAVENQCYVLAAAQGGEHENGRRTWGHSMLIDPWGEIVAQCESGAGVVSGALDARRLAEVRRSLPALAHRVLG